MNKPAGKPVQTKADLRERKNNLDELVSHMNRYAYETYCSVCGGKILAETTVPRPCSECADAEHNRTTEDFAKRLKAGLKKWNDTGQMVQLYDLQREMESNSTNTTERKE